MSEILLAYHKVAPTTWAYLSSLLLIALFFKFNRFFSVRNLDLVLIVLLAPGLLIIQRAHETYSQAVAAAAALPAEPASMEAPGPGSAEAPEAARPATGSALPAEIRAQVQRARWLHWLGFAWLFAMGGLWLVRLLIDPTMVRRPLLEPNLTAGGLTFLGGALFVFLMANVIAGTPSEDDLKGAQGAVAILTRQDSGEPVEAYRRHGPGYYMLHVLPSIATMPFTNGHREGALPSYAPATKAMAVISHLAVVLGMVLIGYWHFENIRMGIGAATLYLMLPYTAQMTGHVDHVLPAALLLWAVVFYRRPLTAGTLIGLAMGVCCPLFLLPLWLSFFWHRGLVRFTLGVLAALGVTALSLIFVSDGLASYWEKLRAMFGLWAPVTVNLEGIWDFWNPIYRLPVLAGFIALSASMAIWPAQKNLGTLLSCSAAIMVATQFWHGYGGGLFMAWHLPLLLLTVFRPNLEDRVALTVLGEGWFTRRRARLVKFEQAA